MRARPPMREFRNWVVDSRRWDAFRPRPGDIVVATYPKSGTTWMQQIVSLLIFQSPEPRPIADIAPWLDMRPLQPPPEALMARLDAQQHRRFLKSHLPFDAMPIYDEVQYIHVARDGRDTCLSYHNHCLALGPSILEAMDEIGRSDATIDIAYPRPPAEPREFYLRWMNFGVAGDQDGNPFGSWFDFEATYWSARSQANLLMVHYRDLKADLAAEMRRIAAFLHIEVPEKVWPHLVKAATFEEMRRVGDQLHPAVARAFVGGTAKFFNRGENDRWLGILNSDDVAAFETRVRQQFEPDCAAWLRDGARRSR